ncbi:MAG: MFS transporter [Planctomycetaceae bacterium]|jgi:OPA family glycerol-3-phosphate transporter-like MFS transporter/OPA family sugar phosphate sensor protein UhpC-like MFS transporter|nr:MFS transporter [Planctomycetaceae bacterium]
MMNQTTHSYGYWRFRILYSTMLGYIFFYFIRKNISMAMPMIEESLGISKIQLGLFLTLHGILYGVSRFFNGVIADRLNPRWFMGIGLLFCAIANFGFGMSSAVWTMGMFWLMNGWFQGMGFPPCAKSLTHWFAAEERGVKFSIWNTSHSLGAGLVFLLNAAILLYVHNWRFCFFIPGSLGVLGAFILFNRLCDTPESMGLEPVEKYYAEKRNRAVETVSPENVSANANESLRATLYKYVFSNPAIWVVSLANFFVYIVRFSILDWAPTFLKEIKHIDITSAGVVSSCYELIGVCGMLCSGLLMDRVFHGRGSKVCFLYMLGCTVTMAFFWWANSSSIVANALFLSVLGFFSYGPQCLIGVIVANVATKKAAAAANGLTGIWGYMSVVVTGWGIGWVAEYYDWNVVFLCLIGASFLAMILFLFSWNAIAPEQIEKKDPA